MTDKELELYWEVKILPQLDKFLKKTEDYVDETELDSYEYTPSWNGGINGGGEPAEEYYDEEEFAEAVAEKAIQFIEDDGLIEYVDIPADIYEGNEEFFDTKTIKYLEGL